MTGWGFVGTGAVARSVASDLALRGSARARAVASRDQDRAQAFTAEFDFERAGDLDRLLDDDDVDVVYIATPHATHRPLALRALAAGKSVVVEKPLGVTADDARAVAEAARRAGRFAMEAMWMRFAPSYRAVLDEVAGGSIGEVTHLRASFGLPFGEPDSAAWSAERASSTLLDQGIYPITLAYDLFGVPTGIEAHGRFRDDAVDLEFRADLAFAGGRSAQIAASMIGFVDPTAAISGRSGWIHIAPPFLATRSYTVHSGDLGSALSAGRTRTFATEGFGYGPMLSAVDDAIGRGWIEHPAHPMADTIAIATVLDRARAAAAPRRSDSPQPAPHKEKQ